MSVCYSKMRVSSSVLLLLMVMTVSARKETNGQGLEPYSTSRSPGGTQHINPWSMPLKWLKIHWYVLLIVGVLLTALMGVVVGVVCLICCQRGQSSHYGKDDVELEELLPREKTRPLISIRKKPKVKQEVDEKTERENSSMAVDSFCRSTQLFQMKRHLPNMGSRIHKYWYEVSTSAGQSSILSIGPIPRRCPLLPLEEKTMKTLNELMKTIQVHPFLQPVEYVHYLSDRKQVIIVQPFSEQGSLKDLIYNVKPDWDWSDKYPESRKQFRPKVQGLPRDKIALYGRQILEAMVFLTEKFSFNGPSVILGHVQSGNIFVQDGVCRLGGYENTLLGYRSRFYRMCQDHLEHMDVIMFGHLVFEMSCAYELSTLAPTNSQYNAIENETIKSILQFIFSYDLSNTISDIVNHQFFQSVQVLQLSGFDSQEVTISKAMKSLIKKSSRDILQEIQVKQILVD